MEKVNLHKLTWEDVNDTSLKGKKQVTEYIDF